MNKYETHEEVVKMARRELEAHERINCWFRPEFVRTLIDRMEEAHKRTGGDAAKLREALKRAWLFVSATRESFAFVHEGRIERDKLCDDIDAALSAPPRNCDMPLVVDGPADNNADKAWLVFKRHNPDAYFDVPGLLRCIDWLLATATKKEGGL